MSISMLKLKIHVKLPPIHLAINVHFFSNNSLEYSNGERKKMIMVERFEGLERSSTRYKTRDGRTERESFFFFLSLSSF